MDRVVPITNWKGREELETSLSASVDPWTTVMKNRPGVPGGGGTDWKRARGNILGP